MRITRRSPAPGRGLRALLGVFSIAAGIVMVAWPALSLVLLLTIVGAWLLFYGLSLIFLAFSLPNSSSSRRPWAIAWRRFITPSFR